MMNYNVLDFDSFMGKITIIHLCHLIIYNYIVKYLIII